MGLLIEMTRDELITFWVNSSDKDFKTMKNLFRSKDYHWSLFIGHLVLEKLLKAYYVKNVDVSPPFIHDLYRIAEKSELLLTEDQKDFLELVSKFNISARYPDFKEKFYKKCTREYAEKNIIKIEEFRKWLQKKIEP